MKKGKSTKSAKTKDFPKKRRKVGKGKRAPENTTASRGGPSTARRIARTYN